MEIMCSISRPLQIKALFSSMMPSSIFFLCLSALESFESFRFRLHQSITIGFIVCALVKRAEPLVG